MQSKELSGNVEENLDEIFFIQRIPFVLQEVYSRWDFTNQYTFANFG
jgi:hypothetical protein